MIKKKISSLLAVSAIICAAAVTTSANAEEVKSTDSNNQVAVQRVNNKKTRSIVAVGQVTANGGLNVRKSPNTNSKILKVLNTGEKVNIKWTEPGWYYIEHKGTEGYVSAKYVKKISSTSSSDGDVVYNATGTVNTSSKIGVNLRKGPSTSSAMIMGIPDGAKLTITAKNGSWYKVSYSGNVGYVHSDYVNIGGNSSSGESSNPSSTYQKILDIMKAQIGSPYVWGGTGEFITNDSINTLRRIFPDANRKGWYDKIPSSYYNNGYRAFDCSGLMQWSFGQAGVSIGRTTYDQIYDGYGVNVNSAKPGDLLIYANKEHVGMYIGNGQWIESPYPGGYVRISNVPWSRIGYARRVL